MQIEGTTCHHTWTAVGYVEPKRMRVLVVFQAVSMVIQMAEGSPWLSNCEPTWCLSAPLTGFFSALCDVQQPAIQSEMPLGL